MGFKVTNPTKGVWHYEYALYNQNLDRAIQSFSVPLLPGVNISNIEFHAPPQHPGWAHDGTQETLDIAAHPGMLLRTQAQLPGVRKHLRRIRMPTHSLGHIV